MNPLHAGQQHYKEMKNLEQAQYQPAQLAC